MPLSRFTDFTAEDCVLLSQRIDIWQYPLHIEFAKAKSLLNDAEIIRANRYHFARHQRRFTVARSVMRLILARYLNVNPEELEFGYNPQGKPFLSNAPTLQFNLSHAGDWALLAVGSGAPLGIDLEFFSARPYEGIGSHIFSARENQSLQQLPASLKPLGFFHLWAQKEALIKACGLGLSYPTKQFDVPLLPPAQITLVDPKFNHTWQISSFMPEAACCAAICYHPDIQEVRYLKLGNVGAMLGHNV